MGNYLYFRLGPYRVVIEAGSVLEIVDSSIGKRHEASARMDDSGHALWRGGAVANMDMMARMQPGRCTEGTKAIVLGYVDGDRTVPLLLKVEEVYDVLTLPDSAFTPLPVSSETLGLYFDALYFHDEERAALLRMRTSSLWSSGDSECAANVG